VRGPNVGQHHRTARVAIAAGAATALALLFTQPAPAAAPGRVSLPSAADALTPQPPLFTTAAPIERRLRAQVASAERIVVRVAPSGRVVSLRVVQRLTLSGAGDYFFAVPAPATDVVPGPGSESESGLRRGAVLWQGFSPGRRVLSADARLEAAAGRALPLRVRVAGLGTRRLLLQIDNRTAARLTSFTAEAVPASLASALATTRRDLRRGRVTPPIAVAVRGAVEQRQRVVGVAFHLRGLLQLPDGVRVVGEPAADGLTATADAGRVTVRGVLPARTARVTLEVALSRPLRRLPALRLVATPVEPLELLETPPGEADGRLLLDRALDGLLGLARARQYEQFLANPDPLGATTATYVYELARAPRTASEAGETGGGGSVWPVVLVVAGLLVAAVGALVAWAHA
jgi:hypothetical protein